MDTAGELLMTLECGPGEAVVVVTDVGGPAVADWLWRQARRTQGAYQSEGTTVILTFRGADAQGRALEFASIVVSNEYAFGDILMRSRRDTEGNDGGE